MKKFIGQTHSIGDYGRSVPPVEVNGEQLTILRAVSAAPFRVPYFLNAIKP